MNREKHQFAQWIFLCTTLAEFFFWILQWGNTIEVGKLKQWLHQCRAFPRSVVTPGYIMTVKTDLCKTKLQQHWLHLKRHQQVNMGSFEPVLTWARQSSDLSKIRKTENSEISITDVFPFCLKYNAYISLFECF